MTTDLVPLNETGLEVRDEDTGQVVGLRFPDGSGDVASFGDPLELGRWRRVLTDLEFGPLRDLKKDVDAVIYDAMDSGDGVYTLHGAGVDIIGEPRGSWENSTTTDAEALFVDLITLRKRTNPDETYEFREAWASSFFKTERTLSDAGRKRLAAMGGVVAETLAEHTTPSERPRKAISVKRVAKARS